MCTWCCEHQNNRRDVCLLHCISSPKGRRVEGTHRITGRGMEYVEQETTRRSRFPSACFCVLSGRPGTALFIVSGLYADCCAPHRTKKMSLKKCKEVPPKMLHAPRKNYEYLAQTINASSEAVPIRTKRSVSTIFHGATWAKHPTSTCTIFCVRVLFGHPIRCCYSIVYTTP